MNRIKRITSHRKYAQFLADCTLAVGSIPRQDIPSPYASSPTHAVHRWGMNLVIVVETDHKRYDVFALPAGITLLPVEDD